jgi:adenosylmethionine-8-amino-7-oxononanoate aminotransferase
MPVFHSAAGGLAFETIVLPSPALTAENSDNDKLWYKEAFKKASEIITEKKNEIAAVIAEPLVQGAAGMLMYPADYLKKLKDLCDEQDILIIADEVFVGYGRTGTFLAHHQAGFGADIVCLAKGFSGGELPMAATVTTDKIFNAFLGDYQKTLWYGHSFTGNPLGCAVADATLDVIEKNDLINKVPEKAAIIQQELNSIKDHPWVKDIRQTGIIAAFTLADPDKKKTASNYLDNAGWQFYEEAKKQGALLRPLGNVIYFVLPLTITHKEINKLFKIVKNSLTALW